ncbi:hypothetical protein CTAYLR_005454 [Chrysophaeum taylorii]|uniref:Fungal lipase-type domain-containing protein n=1 Tax=Chrysophaeum taylorii TaxID=2483200 RepID=A0AAD7UKW4_9STRA|nr:hypothetical protein CTAYLR_005454 [Chrysophaeum taylorii]
MHECKGSGRSELSGSESDESVAGPAAPRILLEVLSPGGTRFMFFVVYASFAIAIWQNAVTTLSVKARRTVRARVEVLPGRIWWQAEAGNLGEVFGTVSVSARFPNATNATAGDEKLGYSIFVKASKAKHATDSSSWSDVLRRHKETVTARPAQNDDDDDDDDDASSSAEDKVWQATQLASWYQNMEAPPSRSRVHSYEVAVEYCFDDGSECPGASPALRAALAAGGEVEIGYNDVSHLETTGAKVARACLIAAWVAIFAAWFPHARREYGAARHALLLASLALFIDPVDCGVQFAPRAADVPPVVAFLSFASRRLGEAGLLAALLVAADADGAAARRVGDAWRDRANRRRGDVRASLLRSLVRAAGEWRRRVDETFSDDDDDDVAPARGSGRRLVVYCLEYAYLAIPLAYVFCGVAALGLRFPSLWGNDRAPTLALTNWPHSALREFVAFSLGIVLAVVAWAACFAYLLWRAQRRLAAAPYLATRRYQLTYRFFVLQAILVAGVAVASYAVLLIELVRGYRRSIAVLTTGGGSTRKALEDLAGALEALVADDVRDLGMAFFFEVYVGLLLYLHLPPPNRDVQSLDRGGDAAIAYVRRFLPQAATAAVQRARREVTELVDLGTMVGARFVFSERADARRRRDWRRRRRHRATSTPADDPPPPDFFVVNTARWLVRVAAEAYFDVASTSETTAPSRVAKATPFENDDDEDDARPPLRRLTGGSAGVGDAARLGLRPICELHLRDSDTYGLVAAHVRKPWLVVAFRGSASLKHWVTNIDIRQHRLSLHDDKPDHVDDHPRPIHVVDHQLPTSDDDDDDDDEDEDPTSATAPRAQQSSRAFVDALVRCAALLYGSIERGLGLVTVTAEAAGRASGAADFIPGVERLVLPCVHRGFWAAYSGVRTTLHRAVYDACLDHNIERVIVTGHSLGGALATLAAADLAAHTIPRVAAARPRPPRLTMVSFGSPRVGNRVWARVYDALVPDSWRVVSDGDVVTGVPRLFFKHCGTPVVVDGHKGGTGFLIVDPSFVEKRLQLRMTPKLSSHFLEAYVRGLWGAAGIQDPSPAELALFANSATPPPVSAPTPVTNLVARARATIAVALRRFRPIPPNNDAARHEALAQPFLPPEDGDENDLRVAHNY